MKRTKGPDDKKGAARKVAPFWRSEACGSTVSHLNGYLFHLQDSNAGLISIVAGDRSYGIGDRWPDTLETHQRLIGAVRPTARQARLRSTPLDAAHLHANATQRRAVEGKPWRLLRVAAQQTHGNDPGAGGAVPRPLVSELRLGGTWGTGLRQPRVLALGYEVGRL
jgi:hypothetical protein